MSKPVSNFVCCSLLFAVFFWCQHVSAQSPAATDVADVFQDCVSNCAPEPLCTGDIWTRPQLTGDWHGYRSSLRNSGITLGGSLTQFAFGVSGGLGPNPPALKPGAPLIPGDTFAYTGRGDYRAIVDLEKFGGLPKGTLFVQIQQWFGQYGNVSLATGSFAPAIFPAALPPQPNDPGALFLTDFLFTQPLSERLVVFAGKKNVLGAVDQDAFAGGNGLDQFMNQALVANPAFLLALPYTSFTAGAVSPQEWGTLKAYVYDPKDRTNEVFRVDDLFSTGIIIGGEVSVKTNFFDRPGDQHVGGIWKHLPLTDLRAGFPAPGVYPEPVVAGVPMLNDSYTIYYGFDQYLVTFADNSKRGWGLFGRASVSDGNPTPLRYFLSAGVGGYSPIRQKQGDTFGLGWYYAGASTQFGPVIQTLFAPRDGTGVELYYNIQATPWCNITPDIQYIHPGSISSARDSFVYGVRAKLTF